MARLLDKEESRDIAMKICPNKISNLTAGTQWDNDANRTGGKFPCKTCAYSVKQVGNQNMKE